jgi:hypothetical protein
VNWLLDNWKLLFDGAGGTAAIAFIAYVYKRWFDSPQQLSGQEGTLTAQGARVSDSPVASGSGITQNINSPTTINVGVPHPPPVPTTKTPQLDPKYNLRFVEAKSVQAHADQDVRIHESAQGLGDFLVSVVCFRNEPVVGKQVQEPMLKSHVTYKDKNGEEIADAPRGVWLGEYGETTHFELGKKKCLIIFVLSKQHTLIKVWNETYTTETSWMANGPLFRIGHDGLPGNVSSVEVRLMAHDICVLHVEFEVGSGIDGGPPKLILRNPSAA